MKKFSRIAIITIALVVSGGLIAGLATAANFSGHKRFDHQGHHGRINALKLDANKDGMLSKEELLSQNTKRFTQLDYNKDGSIGKDEFNARLIVMFKKMDRNGDGVLRSTEMPKRHHVGHDQHD